MCWPFFQFIKHTALDTSAYEQCFGTDHERDSAQDPCNRGISGWLFRHDVGRSKTQTHLDNKMRTLPVFEHLQTLQNGVNWQGSNNPSETNVRKTSDTTHYALYGGSFGSQVRLISLTRLLLSLDAPNYIQPEPCPHLFSKAFYKYLPSKRRCRQSHLLYHTISFFVLDLLWSCCFLPLSPSYEICH